MTTLEYFKGLFTCEIEDNVIGTAAFNRMNVWEPEADIETYPVSESNRELIIADILMAYYRSPKGLEKEIKSGEFSIKMRGDKMSFNDIEYLYQYAQRVYKRYNDAKYEGTQGTVFSV